MTKTEQVAERIIVTFGEAVVAYVAVVPHIKISSGLIVGAIGAGLSALYNLARQAQPTIVNDVTPLVEAVLPVVKPVVVQANTEAAQVVEPTVPPVVPTEPSSPPLA